MKIYAFGRKPLSSCRNVDRLGFFTSGKSSIFHLRGFVPKHCGAGSVKAAISGILVVLVAQPWYKIQK